MNADQAKANLANPQYLQDYENWKEGGPLKLLTHAIVGGLTSGNLSGALGAGTSQAAIPIIGEHIAELDIPVELKKILIQGAGIAIGAATGGTAGAATAQNATANNYLTHVDLKSRQQKLNDCRAKKDPVCEVAVLKEYDKKSATNTGTIDYKNPATKADLEAKRADLQALLTAPNADCDDECKRQAGRSIKELDTALNVINRAPVVDKATLIVGGTAALGTGGAVAAVVGRAALLNPAVATDIAVATGEILSDGALGPGTLAITTGAAAGATKVASTVSDVAADAGKVGVNAGVVVGEVAVTTKSLALPAPKVGEVVPNAMSAAETAQATDIVTFKGGKFVGQQTSNTPGIDGWLNGVPVSLKEVTGNGMTAVQRNIIGGTNQMRNAGQVGDMYVDATKAGVSIQDVTNWVKPGSPIANVLNEGTVNNIIIKTANGWVTLTRSTLKTPGTP